MRVKLTPRNPLTPNVQKYLDEFGHLPSIEAFKFLDSEQMDKLAREAVEKKEPIPEWRDRPRLITDTTLDDFYADQSKGPN